MTGHEPPLGEGPVRPESEASVPRSEWLVCTNCLEQVPADALVCGFCGHRLKTAAADLPAAAPPVVPPEEEQVPVVSARVEPARWFSASAAAPRSRPLARATQTVGAALVLLAPIWPWLSLPDVVGSHTGLDLSLPQLVAGERLGRNLPSIESLGFLVLLLGGLALWATLAARPRWLPRAAGVVAVLLVVSFVVLQARASDRPVFEPLDLGAYLAAAGGLMLIVAPVAGE